MCDKLRVLTWDKNSCYMDSVLFALFSTPQPFVDKFMLKQRYTSTMDGLCGDQSRDMFTAFKKVLKQIVDDLRESTQSKKVCHSFRQFLRTYASCAFVEISSPFANHQQQEAFEFLQFILSGFGFGRRKVGAEIVYRKRYGLKLNSKIEWKEWFSRDDNTYSIVHRVPYQEFTTHKNLGSYLHYKIKDCSLNLQDTKWNGEPVNCFEEHVILQKFADLLILSIERENPASGVIHHQALQIPPTITDCNGKILTLDAVVVHLGKTTKSGHYVCFKKCDDQWFLMDDMKSKLVTYTSWSEVLRSSLANVRTHGVLYFYAHHP